MSNKSLKTPLRYPGGKSRACAKMESFFPDLLDYENYCEPFLGGGSVAIYVTKKFPHLKVWVNDLYLQGGSQNNRGRWRIRQPKA